MKLRLRVGFLRCFIVDGGELLLALYINLSSSSVNTCMRLNKFPPVNDA